MNTSFFFKKTWFIEVLWGKQSPIFFSNFRALSSSIGSNDIKKCSQKVAQWEEEWYLRIMLKVISLVCKDL